MRTFRDIPYYIWIIIGIVLGLFTVSSLTLVFVREDAGDEIWTLIGSALGAAFITIGAFFISEFQSKRHQKRYANSLKSDVYYMYDIAIKLNQTLKNGSTDNPGPIFRDYLSALFDASSILESLTPLESALLPHAVTEIRATLSLTSKLKEKTEGKPSNAQFNESREIVPNIVKRTKAALAALDRAE